MDKGSQLHGRINFKQKMFKIVQISLVIILVFLILNIKPMTVKKAKYEFGPHSYTESKFENATYISWKVSSYTESTPFYTYLFDREAFTKFVQGGSEAKVQSERYLSFASESMGEKVMDGSKDFFLVFHNPSECPIVSDFYLTDSKYVDLINFYYILATWNWENISWWTIFQYIFAFTVITVSSVLGYFTLPKS